MMNIVHGFMKKLLGIVVHEKGVRDIGYGFV